MLIDGVASIRIDEEQGGKHIQADDGRSDVGGSGRLRSPRALGRERIRHLERLPFGPASLSTPQIRCRSVLTESWLALGYREADPPTNCPCHSSYRIAAS